MMSYVWPKTDLASRIRFQRGVKRGLAAYYYSSVFGDRGGKRNYELRSALVDRLLNDEKRIRDAKFVYHIEVGERDEFDRRIIDVRRDGGEIHCI